MVNYCRIFVICFLLLGYSAAVNAEVVITATVDKNKLSQDETLTLSIDISGDINSPPKIQMTDLDKDFQILSSVKSQNISLKSEKSNLVINLKYILLPKNHGKLTIGSVEAKYKDKVYKTEPIEIEVTEPLKPEIPKPETPPGKDSEGTIL